MKAAAVSLLTTLVAWSYRFGSRLYPSGLRSEFGTEMVDHVHRSLEAAGRRRGVWGVIGEGRRLAIDLVLSVGREWRIHLADGSHRGARRSSRRAERSPGKGDGMWRAMRHDLKIAGRSLRRARAFTIVVTATLAVGIGANVAMFDTISQAFLRPLPFADPDRLVIGQTTFGGNPNPTGSTPDYFDYKDRAESFESVAAFMPFPLSQPVTGGDTPEMVTTQMVTWDYLRTLGVVPQLGRDFNPDEGEDGGPRVVLLSHGFWQRRFGGDPSAVGRTLVVGGEPVTVIGVVPPNRHLIVAADLWVPLQPSGPFAGVRRFHNWLTVARLAEGTSIEQAQSEADLIYAQLARAYPESNADKGLRVTPLREVLLAGSRQALLLLWGAIALVLLIACGNVAGLLLARGASRTTELSVRAALGASRGRLVGYLLTESLVLAFCGGAAGLALAAALRAVIARLVPTNVPGGLASGLAPDVVLFAVALTLATGLLFGLAPALRGAGADVARDLRSGRRAAGEAGSARLRSLLVVAQVALSVVLLVGSGLLVRSFARISNVDPGFESRDLLTAEIRLPRSEYPGPVDREQFFQDLLERIEGLPNVESAAAVSMLPIANPGNNVLAWAADRPPLEPGDAPIVYQRTIFRDYFRTLGIPILSGRSLDRTDARDAPRVIVINEALALRLFPNEEPLGRVVAVDVGADEPERYEVVGVTGDARITALGRESQPAMYFSYGQRGSGLMRLAIRTRGRPEAITSAVRAAVRELDPDLPLAAVSSMEEVLDRSVSNYRVMAVALSLFGAVALFLSALGLYGILAFYVGRRVHEIGVRVALGADRIGVVGLVFRRGIGLVLVGLVVGMGAAMLSAGVLRQLLFGVEPTDPVTFAGVGLFFLTVAALASFIPGLRAASIDPAVAFRLE